MSQDKYNTDPFEVIKGSKECLAINVIPSEELKEYHRNSGIQIIHKGKSYLRRFTTPANGLSKDMGQYEPR